MPTLQGFKRFKPSNSPSNQTIASLTQPLRPVGAGVDIERDEFDSPIGSELTNDGKRPDQWAGSNEEPIVVSTWDEFGQAPESGGEPFDDFEQLERLEVVR